MNPARASSGVLECPGGPLRATKMRFTTKGRQKRNQQLAR